MFKKGNDRRLKGFGNFLREEEGMGTVEIIPLPCCCLW